VSVALFRIDDRLIHGQVVVGWGQTLGIDFLVLVDDDVRASDWEQELYRMGVPPAVAVTFASVDEAAAQLPSWQGEDRRGIVLTGDVASMARLAAAAPGSVRQVNVGGVHYREGRKERLRYVYLTDAEAGTLRDMAASGVEVTAQDVPTGTRVPLAEFCA
jgi:PTS system mannose-specific IIB component/fructoselysine and glucoselysine-specific PTS system IIB component